MNGLNSVILEGSISSISFFDYYSSFSLSFNRSFSDFNGQIVVEHSSIDVLCYSNLFTSFSNSHAKIGSSLRVIGRLRLDKFINPDNSTSSNIVLIAEHIEFKSL